MKLGRIIVMILLACVVSAYLFPFAFSFFPPSLNTKQILAVVGIIAFVFRGRASNSWTMTKQIVISAMLAVVFSVWCYLCVYVNNTDDTVYATYFVSFSVWLGGAFGVVSILRLYHEKVDLPLVTKYMAAVCVAQCVLALMIDNIPAFKLLVDSYINQGQEFMDEVNRLYGIGASLDPAGVRFSVVLVLLAHQIAKNKEIYSDNKWLGLCIVAFIAISIIGNMIARTTSVGMIMGLGYIGLNSFMTRRHSMTKGQIRTIAVFAILLGFTVLFLIYLYNTNREAHQLLRFAFEGFFNWVETGEFRTDSTDKLNSVMWKWPSDTESWIFGTGLFDNFVYGTDIGYCRFTLYCGLVGLALFSLFFIYNGLSVIPKFNDSSFLMFLIIALTFVIWLKVATDIFFINTILFCIDSDEDDVDELELAEE